MKKVWIYGLGMALGLVLAGTSWASFTCTFDAICSNTHSICGDSVNPFAVTGDGCCFFSGDDVAEDVPCECGDTVHTDTTLNGGDPVTFGPCSGDGLHVADDVSKLDCASFLLLGSGSGDGLVLDTVSDVLLHKCFVEDFNLGIHVTNSSNIDLEDTKAFFNTNGIDVNDSNHVTIHDAFASKNTDNGMAFDNDSDSNVQGNRMENNGFDGFRCDADCSNVTVQQNQANNNGQDVTVHGDGIEFEGPGSDNKVLNNTARGNCPSCTDDEGNGISLEGPFTGSVVTGNRVTGNHRGIFLEEDSGSPGGSNVSGNYASSNTGPGISIQSDGNTVSNNGGERNGGNGLEVNGGGSGNALSENIFNRNGGHGICTVSGDTDGGGNKGVKNGTLPNVNINGGC